MDVFWIAVGALVLVATLTDTFLTVLSYNESGLFVNRIVRVTWIGIRSLTRRMSRRWRPLVLRQVTGVLLVTTVVWWVAGIVVGWALIYYGAILADQIEVHRGAPDGFWAALYLSLGQFSTVGVHNMTPVHPVIDILTVLQALSSVILVSMTVTFLLNVFGAIRALHALCSDFGEGGRGAGDPLDVLVPFFAGGLPHDVNRLLSDLRVDLGAYADSLRANRAAYYFQSGEDSFSVPYAIHSTSGVVAALRWGLPSSASIADAPDLPRLQRGIEGFRRWLDGAIGFRYTRPPARLDRARFEAELRRFDEGLLAIDEPGDPWLARFHAMCRRMAELTRPSEPVPTFAEVFADLDDAYTRYRAWLPFASSMQQFTAAVARDLDYQPLYRRGTPQPLGSLASDAPVSPEPHVSSGPAAPSPRRSRGLRAWLRRRRLFIDPGSFRMAAGLRSLGAAVAAVLITLACAELLGLPGPQLAVFAGMMTIFSAAAAEPAGTGVRRLAGLLAIVPMTVSLGLAALLRDDLWVVVPAIAATAFLAVFAGRLGPRWGSLGQLGFIAFYFAMLQGATLGTLPGLVLAGSVAIVCGMAVAMLPEADTRHRVIGAGVTGYVEHVAQYLSRVTNAILEGSVDRRTERAIAGDARAVRTAGTMLAGRLHMTSGHFRSGRSLTADEVLVLRGRLLAVDVAVAGLADALPSSSEPGLTLEEAAHLGADAEGALAALRDEPAEGGAVGATSRHEELPLGSGARARAVHAELAHLVEAVRALQGTSESELRAAAAGVEAEVSLPFDADALANVGAGGAAPTGRPANRRAAQAALATGSALAVGAMISPAHPYWAAMPAYAVLQNSDGETRVRALERILGTVLGAFAGFALAALTMNTPWVDVLLIAVCVFAMGFARGVSAGWQTVWQTALFALLYDVLGRLDLEVVHIRLVETAVGAIIAAVVAAAVLPLRTRARVLSSMAEAVASTGRVASLALSRLAGDRVPDEEIAAAQFAMMESVSHASEAATPVRRDPGSLRRSGVEAQLTALWAAAAAARQLAISARRSPGEGIALWKAAASDTAENVAGTLAVLSGSLPSHVRRPSDIGAPEGLASGADITTQTDADMLTHVRSLNRALLALDDAVKPGSVGEGARP